MTNKDFNINPYYDDFDETKGFVRILYRPGIAVQARELTQQQTIIQKQIERFGNHVFEDGSVVTGGEKVLDLDVTYIKLNDTYLGSNINVANFDGALVEGSTSGAVGRVVIVTEETTSDPATIFVKMISGSFEVGENIFNQTTLVTATIQPTGSVGKASTIGIEEGVYFINGIFVFLNKQLLILDKYSNTPSYRIGLTVNESVITANDDESLKDPSMGFTNSLAPGADRFVINLILEKKSLDFTDDIDNSATAKFIEILRVEEGVRTKDIKYSIYSDLADNLARRTFDESGNYTVEPFPIDITDNLTDTTKVNVNLEPGKAYIKGYEHRTIAPQVLSLNKGRDTAEVNNFDINTQYGNYVIVNGINGVFDPAQMIQVKLVSTNIAGTSSGNYVTNTIGTAFLRYVDYFSGTVAPYKYKMYLFKIEMDSGSSIKDVNSIWFGAYADGVNANIDTTDGQDASNDTLLFGSANNSLLFKTPHTAVETLKPDGTSDTSYSTQRTYSLTFESGVSSVNESGLTTFFGASGALASDVIRQNYYVILETVAVAGATGYAVGDVIDFDVAGRSITLSGGNQTVTLEVNDAAFDATGKLIAKINLDEKAEKVKTLNTETVTGLSLTSGKVSLGYSDIYSIVSVTDTGDSDADVTEFFALDTGQRDNLYDHGSISIIPGNSVVGPLDVEFQYFSHSGSGYFSVDSYSINYEDIPNYITSSGEVFNLRDVIDFRPRRADNDTDISLPASGADLPEPNSNVSADYSFYLPRIDKIVLTENREFQVIEGVSSLDPVIPNDQENFMTLYALRIPAYTFSAGDVTVEYVDNKRYTMKDVGSLDRRLTNLEYYTALSFLEKETKDLVITDSSGDEMFKSGILVDNFSGHSIGDVLNPDYNCSIDFENGILRPSFNESQVKFELDEAASTNVSQIDDLLMLDYTETSFVKQILYSSSITVNPFNTTGWIGTSKLEPSQDTWYDTASSPKVITNTSGENDAWKELGFGTQWNNWITNWAGLQEEEDIEAKENNDTQRETQEISKANTLQKLKSKFAPKAILRKIGNKISNESIVPYIRAQTITFSADGLKPNTRVYPFFDGVNVSIYCTPSGGSLGGNLVTDSNGSVSGTFALPNTNSVKFKTGERLFKLTDSSTNSLTSTTTSTETRFISKGLVNTQDETISSTRPALIRRNANGDSVLLRDAISREQITSNNIITTQNWIDPLAQVFSVDSAKYKNGVHVSSLNLYFTQKDASIPITIEIRPTINGYPHSSLIVPFSQKTIQSDDVIAIADGSLPTTITFDAPVFLKPGEYSIVIITNSSEYAISSAIYGQNVTDTSLRITQQPFVKSLFKAQNIGNYSPSNLEAIKFELKRCTFDLTSGEIILDNITPEADILMDVMYMISSQNLPSGTSAKYYYKATGLASDTLDSSWIPFLRDQNFKFNSQKIVKDDADDTLSIKIELTSGSTEVSPIIDMERLSIIGIENVVNNDSTNEDSTSGGNALSKYITRKVSLEEGFEATGIKVILSSYVTGGASTEVYYKVLAPDDVEDFDDKNWVQLTQSSPTSLSRNENNYVTQEFMSENVSYDGFNKYKTFAIKIVLLSNSTSDVPKVKNARVIALKA